MLSAESQEMILDKISALACEVRDLSDRDNLLFENYSEQEVDVVRGFLDEYREKLEKELIYFVRIADQIGVPVMEKKISKAYEDYERFKDVRCEDVINHYLKPVGEAYNCPFHTDKTPSLKIDKARNRWKCFGCGEGGQAVNFIMLYENCDFKEAVNILKRF